MTDLPPIELTIEPAPGGLLLLVAHDRGRRWVVKRGGRGTETYLLAAARQIERDWRCAKLVESVP